MALRHLAYSSRLCSHSRNAPWLLQTCAEARASSRPCFARQAQQRAYVREMAGATSDASASASASDGDDDDEEDDERTAAAAARPAAGGGGGVRRGKGKWGSAAGEPPVRAELLAQLQLDEEA